ncbi:hypothetical protein B0H13DRAFT_2043258 [Mycena leptocephala]|nr:hypothetical protein B0H13DRAFT_2063141 [Mycena leptocephala]KAJ7887170.1 hypothetical protein B0H13DRAFT_2043258 [Mycena leptocephala]
MRHLPRVYLISFIKHGSKANPTASQLRNYRRKPDTRRINAVRIPSVLGAFNITCNQTAPWPTTSIAPKPLLPNYGQPQRFIHCRDLNMMNLINGTERTVSEMTHVIESAGLVVEKIWECRGAVHITEYVLPAGVSA